MVSACNFCHWYNFVVRYKSVVMGHGYKRSVLNINCLTVSAFIKRSVSLLFTGNGPSAIILSYFLSGHWPYYNGKPVNDPILQERLKFVSQKKSIVVQVYQSCNSVEVYISSP